MVSTLPKTPIALKKLLAGDAAPLSIKVSMMAGLIALAAVVSGCGQSEDQETDQDKAGAEDVPGAVSMPKGAEALGQTSKSSSDGQSVKAGGTSGSDGSKGVADAPDLGSLITSQAQLYAYVQDSIGSALDGTPSSLGSEKAIVDDPSLLLASGSLTPISPLAAVQSSQYPLCSTEGDPWDSAQKKLMSPTTKDYSQAAFYCQLNASDSRKTVRGALDQNRRILCDVEKTLGSLAFDTKEKIYTGVVITLSAGCGWTAKDLANFGKTQITGSVRTQALDVGEWQKKLVLDFPGSVVMTLYATVTKTSVAFKEIQGWKKVEEKTSNQYLAQDATGSHGHVIHLDYAQGTLRAETADTYWGRRVRLVAKGEVDATTGRFKRVDSLNGILSRFNKAGDEGHTYIDNAVASVAGNAISGFAYLSGTYYCPQDAACNPNNEDLFALTLLNQSKINCVPLTSKCLGNNGLPFSLSPSVLHYLMIGAAWDDQVKKRPQFDSWLTKAGIPTFNTVDFSIVLGL